MFTSMLGVLLLGAVPVNVGYKVDIVEEVEINSKIGADGQVVFQQIIFWDKSNHVIDYKMVNPQFSAGTKQIFCKEMNTPLKFILFDDGPGMCMVKAPVIFESFTRDDPEMLDREFIRTEDRRGLSPWPKIKELPPEKVEPSDEEIDFD